MILGKIRDDDCEELSMAREPWHNGDWPVWFAVRVQYTEEYDSEWAEQYGKYCVELHAIAPQACSFETLESAARGCYDPRETAWDSDAACERVWAEVLLSYGVSATLFSDTGNNKHKLLRAARRELRETVAFTFGFRMDAQQNAIGASGWDFIKGDPAMRGDA